MENNKKYWFFLESYIYVNIKSSVVLLYDTYSGKNISVESVVAVQMVNKIYEDKNLGCIELRQSDLMISEAYSFVNCVVVNGMGKLLDQSVHPIKPVILLPILSLNFDVEKFRDNENSDLFLSRDISKYLLDVNIILNSSCQQKCLQCRNYHKQFLCCNKHFLQSDLPKDSLISLLRQINYFPVRTINITGGNIYLYHCLDVFNVSNGNCKKEFNFYVHYLNYEENDNIDSQSIHLIINTPVNLSKLHHVHFLTKEKNVKYHLIVEDEEQYIALESLMAEMEIDNFEVHPYYNGQNMQFFEDNVYLSKDDIFASTISMREIFRNQKLNANFFGSLYILPNGEIKSNLNKETIGHIGVDRIIDVIHREMMQNTAWRQIRSSEPCKSCLYQYLCPPLSNYEIVLNKQNLCHIIK